MASNPFTKHSYLDGVPFAINPVFLLDTKDSKSLKSSEKIERSALNYDLNKSFSLLDTKIDFFTETNVLLSETIKKQKKNVDETKNLLIVNSNYRNKSSSLSKSQTGDPSSLPNLSVETYSTSLSSLPNSIGNKIQILNDVSKTIISSNKPDLSLTHAKSITQGVIHPINLNANNSKLLEPIRHPLNQTTTSSTSSKSNETNSSNNDSNNNNTSRDVNYLKNSNTFKDLFNSFESSSLDPFNDMELKTINDLEELKTILQNHQTSQQEAQKQTSNVSKSELQSQQAPHENSVLNSTNIRLIQTNNWGSLTETNFGLPKVSFVDLDINSNKF